MWRTGYNCDEMSTSTTDLIDTHCQTSERLNLEGFPDEALAEADRALSLEPHNPRARFQKAYSLFLLGSLAQAGDVLDDLCQTSPDYPNAQWLRAGVLRRRLGDHDPNVLGAYRQALDSDSANLYIQSEIADVLRARGAYAEARAMYRQLASHEACEDEALRIEATFQLGVVSQVLGELDEALAAFSTVLEQMPDYPDAREMVELLSASPGSEEPGRGYKPTLL